MNVINATLTLCRDVGYKITRVVPIDIIITRLDRREVYIHCDRGIHIYILYLFIRI